MTALALATTVPAEARPNRAARAGINIPVTANVAQAAMAKNSPMIAADPNEPRLMALASRIDAPEFGCELQLSGDGGRSWIPADPVPRLPKGVERCYGPEVAFDGNGKLYFLFAGLAGRGNTPVGIFLTSSVDRGQSFKTPVKVVGENAFQAKMVIDKNRGKNGRIYLVWLQANGPPPLGGLPAGPNPILSAYSDNAGSAFSKPVQVNDEDRPRSVAPAIALGSDHQVHVLYYDLGDDAIDYQGLEGPVWESNWSLILASSRDGGRSFGRGVMVDSGLVPPERVMLIFTMPSAALAAGPGGRLYAAWSDARNGDWDAYLRASGDSGRHWGSVRRLNDDSLKNGRHQYLPRLSVAPNGRVDAVFYDRRLDPANTLNHVYLTYSTDHAKSFRPNLRLTEFESDTRFGESYPIPSAKGQIEFGSRLGLYSADSKAVAAWTDTQNADGPKQQDIFSAKVTFPGSTPTSRSRSPVLGVTLALVLAVGAMLFLRKRRKSGPSGLVLGITFVIVLNLAGCSTRPLPSSAPTIKVRMREYSLAFKTSIPAGRVVFIGTNRGTIRHQMTLLALPADLPPLTRQLRSETKRQVAATIAATRVVDPGQYATFAADLAPGRYGLLCFVKEPKERSHAVKGMAKEFKVG